MKAQPSRAEHRRMDGSACSSRTEAKLAACRFLILVVLGTILGWTLKAQAQGTPVAYRGQLTVGGGSPDPAERFDLRFRLYDVATGGVPLDEALAPAVGTDTNGVFTVLLDASDTWDNYAEQWIELGARRSGTTSDYTPLLPRQQLTAVPKAVHARRADVATGLAGPLAVSQLPAGVARLDIPQTFTAPPSFIPASGAPFTVGMTTTVQRLSADLLDGLDATAFWQRATNDGVGSLVEPEDRPLEIRVQSTRVLRLQKGDSNSGWSVVGGSAGNTAANGVGGVVIGGGRGNVVEGGAHYSSVLGGDGNRMGSNAWSSTIGGGTGNRIGPDSAFSGVFSGFWNVVSSNSSSAGVLLGGSGQVREFSDFAAIMSGENNIVGPNAAYAAIASGQACRIEKYGGYSFIGGGRANVIHTNASLAAILSGGHNTVGREALGSVVVGGSENQIGAQANNAFLGGGQANTIEPLATYSVIHGGYGNLVRSNAQWATVLGGASSVAGAPFTIAGGHQARAEHTGSIVLADGQYGDFVSSNAYEFAVRAAGGVRFVTGGAGLFVDGQRVGTGGGTVVTNSGNADTLDGLDSSAFWRLTGNAGTTSGVHFLGTTDAEPIELKVGAQRALRLEPTVGSPNVVAGHAANTVSSGVSGAAIGGGGSPGLFGVTFPNRVTDSFGVVAGGFLNLAGTDDADVEDSLGATVAGGLANSASAQEAFTGGGSSNTVRALAGAILGGQQNLIDTNAPFAAIAGGLQARATLPGQVAHASGAFARPGDAQASQFVLRGTTTLWSTNAPEVGQQVPLTLDGGTNELRLPGRATWTFDILIAAQREDGASAGYHIQGVAKPVPVYLEGTPICIGYGAQFVGTPRINTLAEDPEVAEWTVEVVASTSGDLWSPEPALRLLVTDRYGLFWPTPDYPQPWVTRWVATVRTAEVMF